MIKNFPKHVALLFLCILISVHTVHAQVYTSEDVRAQMDRIDAFDGEIDGIVTLHTFHQTRRASFVFQSMPNRIMQFLLDENKGITYSRRVYKDLYEILSKVNRSDYFQINYYEKLFNLFEMILMNPNDTEVLEQCKAESLIAMKLPESLKTRKWARDFWLFSIRFYPTQVLNQFIHLYNEPYALEILEAVALDAPTVMKEYFGSNHLNYRLLKETQDTRVKKLLEIHRLKGSASKAYILLDDLISQRLTIEEAHLTSAYPEKLLLHLIDMRKRGVIYGNYSVEKELQALCMEMIVEINLRHDDSEAYRFEPINNKSAEQIYTYIVYTPEEIFTSTFLGLYSRMMSKREQKSGFEFLKSLHFNHFRVFLKLCAGYGKLDDFLSTMNAEETKLLFELLCKDLDQTGGDLGPSVDICDFYGSLKNSKLKTMLRDEIEKNLIDRASREHIQGMKIYGLLFKIMGGNPNEYIWQFEFDLPLPDRMSHQELFTDGIHIQQHFFFDDDDGKTAYQSFMSTFGSQWKISDHNTYKLVETRSGPTMQIYVVKPEHEIEARQELRAYFDKKNRFPDLVVHRGHSYYVEHTIAALTNHTKVAILGSCGGFHNISQAMENAMDVHIVSTKQIGTLLINNALIVETIETLRKGKDLVWPELWSRVRSRVGGNPRFNDYVPPHLNMGARFIKAYHELTLVKSE